MHTTAVSRKHGVHIPVPGTGVFASRQGGVLGREKLRALSLVLVDHLLFPR